MKWLFKLILFLLLFTEAKGQQDIVNNLLETSVIRIPQNNRLDSLHYLLIHASSDSMRIIVNRAMATYFEEANRDSALYYFTQFYLLAKKLNYKQTEIRGLFEMSIQLDEKSDYVQSYQYLLIAKELADDPRNEKKEYNFYQFLPDTTFLVPANLRLFHQALVNCGFAYLYRSVGDLNNMLIYAWKAIQILQNFRIHGYYRTLYLAINNNILGEGYYLLNRLDSALYLFKKSMQYYQEVGEKKYLSQPLKNIADIYNKTGNKQTAARYYLSAIKESLESKEGSNYGIIGSCYQQLSRIFNEGNQLDSSTYYASLALGAYGKIGSSWGIKDAYRNLSEIYIRQNNKDSIKKYLLLANKDSLYEDKIKRLQSYLTLSFNYQLLLQEQQKEKIETQDKV